MFRFEGASGSIAAKLRTDPELIGIARDNLARWTASGSRSQPSAHEAEVFPREHPERSDLIDGTIGEGSPFQQSFGYYAHGVDYAAGREKDREFTTVLAGTRWCPIKCCGSVWQRLLVARRIQADFPGSGD